MTYKIKRFGVILGGWYDDLTDPVLSNPNSSWLDKVKRRGRNLFRDNIQRDVIKGTTGIDLTPKVPGSK